MDIFGIGPMELLVIALVAMIVLGPAKTLTMARSLGDMMRDVRQSLSDISTSLTEEEIQAKSLGEWAKQVNPNAPDKRGDSS